MKRIVYFILMLLPITAMSQSAMIRKGTSVTLRSVKKYKSDELKPGQRLEFRVESAIIENGEVLISQGAKAIGEVISSSKGRAGGFPGTIQYALKYVELDNGRQVFLDNEPKEVKGKNKMGVAAATGMLTMGFGALKKGGNAEIDSEDLIMGIVAQDIALSSSNPSYNNIANSNLQQQQTVFAQQAAVQQQMQESTATEEKIIPSDVDIDIPTTSKKSENAFAIIIANEKYQNEVDVKYAMNDGRTFRKYCEQTLGIPAEQIHYRENATLNNIIGEVDWLKKVCTVFDGDARIIFYYAGHGIPDESSKDAYLLPVDGTGTNVETGYKLSNLYEVLGNLNTTNVSVFLDACFSGAQRDNGMLASARGVAIKAKPQAPIGSMVVMSAAQGDETAYPYKEKSHGLFTYFLLKKMQETKGDCTMLELADYVKKQVSRRSIVVNNKPQTPAVSHSVTLGENWKDLKLR